MNNTSLCTVFFLKTRQTSNLHIPQEYDSQVLMFLNYKIKNLDISPIDVVLTIEQENKCGSSNRFYFK